MAVRRGRIHADIDGKAVVVAAAGGAGWPVHHDRGGPEAGGGGAGAGAGRGWLGVGADRAAEADPDRGAVAGGVGDAGGSAIRPALRGALARPGEGAAGDARAVPVRGGTGRWAQDA